jgi:hypothetical protein
MSYTGRRIFPWCLVDLKSSHTTSSIPLLVAILWLSASVGWANMISNPGFATQGSDAAHAQAWEGNVTGGMWGNSERSNWNNNDSDGYSDLIKGNWGGNTYGGSWQKMSVTAGQTYQADAWFYVDNGWAASTWQMKIEWHDSQGTFISEQVLNITGVPQSTWTKKSVSSQAPANATYAHFVMLTDGIGSSGAMYMDQVNFDQVAGDPGWGIRNAGFETQGSSDTVAQYWDGNNGGVWGGSARRAWTKRSGDWSMALQGNWSGFDYAGIWQSIVVTAGTPYVVKAWFHRDDGWTASSLTLKIEWYNSLDSLISESTLDVNNLAGYTWTEKTLTATAPSGSAKAHVTVSASGIGASACCYIDDMSIVPTNLPPPSAVALSVDVGTDRKLISKYLYGLNIANWAAGYYLDLCAPMVKDAGFSVIRYGATNIERYNYLNNRLYNVISRLNQYVPMSWESFVDWCLDDLQADPLVQVSVFSHVAGDGWGLGDPTYDHVQTMAEVSNWIASAGPYVKFWGIGNEPMIAWKRKDYPGHFGDAAHGDQVLNSDVSYDNYFPKFIQIANTIKGANPNAKILGPTPANWWLYWSSDYSPNCPVTTPNGDPQVNHPGWVEMSKMSNQWSQNTFPSRGGDPDVVGWETETNRFLCQYAARLNKAEQDYGKQLADFMDVHRYMNCWTDKDAINEPRGLYEDGFQSWDQETGCMGTETKLFKRFQNIIDTHYPGLDMSLSEYDFFYWNGHPSIPQVAAVGQMEYLGIFANMGIQLACNWYLGEPDQSGGDFEHASDASKQAMFNEEGQPNPKYWVIWMMRRYFDDTVVKAESSSNNQFAVYACHRTNANEVAVFVANKGEYNTDGSLADLQPARTAEIAITNAAVSSLKKILRFGHHDPYPVEMDLTGVTLSNGKVSYPFESLAIYAFIFSTTGQVEAPTNYLHVNPRHVDFGPYKTGSETVEEETHYTHPIKISNGRQGTTSWSVSENCSWLSVVNASGTAKVTDMANLVVNRSGLAYGRHSTTVTVTTAEGTVLVPVSVDVIPGENQGEKRICDFDTGSLAHTWNISAPYSFGWWDGHGNPEDRNSPYIYKLSLDHNEKSRLGSLAAMRIDYNRANGDLGNGRLYSSFGTYGHKSILKHHDGSAETNNATGDWTGYDSLQFDVKAKTTGIGPTKTRFLLTIIDEDGHTGKPLVAGMANYKDLIEIEDDEWTTITIPLNGTFYNWAYPGGQDGSSVQMNLAKIFSIQFTPWVTDETKSGVMFLDNFRLVRADASNNKRPTAVATQAKKIANPGEQIVLNGSGSTDSDGTISSYRWEPATSLSNPNSANPTFSSTVSGTHVYDLIVTDNTGAESRNLAQVAITVLPQLSGQSIALYRDADMTDTNVGPDSLEVFVKLTATSGGNPDAVDFTVCNVSSSDPYTGDQYNNCNAIQVMMVETSPNTKIYTGSFKVGAFSDDEADRIGCSEGRVVTAASSDGTATKAFTFKRPTYGLWRWVDRIELDLWKPNHFEGYACSYDDHKYTNNSVAYVNYVDGGTPHTNSTKCLQGDLTLNLGVSQDYYRLFAGISCKLNPFGETSSNTTQNADLRPSTTWTKGVSFWLKGNGKMLSVVVKSAHVHDYDDYVFTMANTPNQWRRYFIPLSEFKQEGWGTPVDFDTAMSQVEAIQFKAASKTDDEYSQIFVDDVALFGGRIAPVAALVSWPGSSYTFENDIRYDNIGWDVWGAGLGYGLWTGMPHFEGNAAFMTVNSTAQGWWMGSFVPKMTNRAYAMPSVTNLANVDGIAIRLWRRDVANSTTPYTNYPTPDGSPMRVRMVVSENAGDEFANAGVSRWFVVDSTSSDSDYILFPKDKFYTEATVDAQVTNDVLPWVQWNGNWSNIKKFRIDFGGMSATAKPCWVFLDDLKTYVDEAGQYPCPW